MAHIFKYWDAIVITGRASSPSILLIDEDHLRLCPAGELWGLGIPATQRRLRGTWDHAYRFAVIGPAGEQLLRYATISHDGRHAGRGGLGGVMGSKQLKTIGVRGYRRSDWAHPQQLYDYARRLSERSLGSVTAKYRELGTAANLLTFNRRQTLPNRNFQQSHFDGAEQLAPESLIASHARVRQSCVACTIGCEHLYGRPGHETPVRIEYESLFALGSVCDVSDPDRVLEAGPGVRAGRC